MVGYLMSLFEQKIEKIKRKRSKCYNLHRILNTRDKLFYQNFDEIARSFYNKKKFLSTQPLEKLLNESESDIVHQNEQDDEKQYPSFDIEFTNTFINKIQSKVVPLDSIIYL
jgi:hypothetical protein